MFKQNSILSVTVMLRNKAWFFKSAAGQTGRLTSGLHERTLTVELSAQLLILT